MLLSSLIVASLFVGFLSDTTTSPRYELKPISRLLGRYHLLTSINSNGQACGTFEDQNGRNNAFMLESGKVTIIPHISGCDRMSAVSISNDGLVLGNAEYKRSPGESSGFVFANGKTRLLKVRGFDSTFATCVLTHRLIVGYAANTTNGTVRAIAWVDNRPIVLKSGSEQSFAYSVNCHGVIAGVVGSKAVIWRHVDEEPLFEVPDADFSAAYSINNDGNIAGEFHALNGGTHAYYKSKGVLIDLGTLLGSTNSTAANVNNLGSVVGTCSTDKSNSERAFLWSAGAMYNLNDLVINAKQWSIRSASAINDKGIIVGNGDYLGTCSAFVLTPLKESSVVERDQH